MSDLRKWTLQPPRGFIPPPRRRPESEQWEEDDDKPPRRKKEDHKPPYSPADWWDYFRKGVHVEIRNGDKLGLWTTHSITGKGGETLLDPPKDSAFILMLHGGGYSGLTWAPLVEELGYLIAAEYGALDLRGHGESECADEGAMSLENLTQDVIDAIEWMKEGQVKLGTRPLVLVGHSMGGALAVNVALKLQDRSDINLVGLVVLDVVEGTALAALSSMRSVLRSRPVSFPSMTEGIQWCVRSGLTKNVESARISVLGQLAPVRVVDATTNGDDTPPVHKKLWEYVIGDPEAEAFDEPCEWRTDLFKTEKYWRGWFEGLSKKFLGVKCPKLLMLAGVDRLDKDMMVGQMQGKFQMQVFHKVGHAVHEDAPDQAAETIAGFLSRQKIVQTKTKLTPHMPGC